MLLVRLTEDTAPQNGNRLQVETPRAATPVDQQYVPAQNEDQPGRTALENNGDKRAALKLADQAAQFRQQQNEAQWEAVTVHLIGWLQMELGSFGETRNVLRVVTAKQITSYKLPARAVIESAATKSCDLLTQSKQRRTRNARIGAARRVAPA